MIPAHSASISILAVDESALCRKFLSAAISATPGAVLAGVAANASIAVQKLGCREADLILLGLGAAESIATFHALRKAFPEIGIIIVGSLNEKRVHPTIMAMQEGALHFMSRPERLDTAEAIAAFSGQLMPLLRQIALHLAPRPHREAVPGGPHQAESRTIPITPGPAPGIRPRPSSFDLVAVAVSTGGPKALSQVIPFFPENLGVPILIVQHMPAVFTSALAESLDGRSRLEVKEAEDGESVQPNKVYLAPGGRHMIVRQRQKAGPRLEIRLHDAPPVKSCRPSADLLFQSLAENFTGSVLAVIMTGMGDDGADGIRRLKQESCYCLSQSRESCVVYGMPRAVESSGLADEVLPLQAMAGRIAELVRN